LADRGENDGEEEAGSETEAEYKIGELFCCCITWQERKKIGGETDGTSRVTEGGGNIYLKRRAISFGGVNVEHGGGW